MEHPQSVSAVNQPKPADAFRNFAAEERPSVREFYRQNHTHQTVDFVRAKKREFLALKRQFDPGEVFQSNWYRHYREMLNAER